MIIAGNWAGWTLLTGLKPRTLSAKVKIFRILGSAINVMKQESFLGTGFDQFILSAISQTASTGIPR